MTLGIDIMTQRLIKKANEIKKNTMAPQHSPVAYT